LKGNTLSLILIDGSALCYRSHYAFANRPLTAPNGELTSVAHGFFTGVLRLVDLYQPTKLAVVLDAKGKNFRHEMYPDYKAHRKPMPEELAEQLPRLRELLQAWGVPVLEIPDVEADDVMATMAERSVSVVDKTWFFTGDKDFMQLLDERTSMLKPGRRGDEITALTADDVRRQYKLEPVDLIQVFALSGDKADNIPGAPGIGDKTALTIIQEFGNLENLFEKLEASKLTSRVKRVLQENREQVFLSRDLFVIKKDLDLELDWDAMATLLPTGSEVTRMLQDLGLRRVQNYAQQLARRFPEFNGEKKGAGGTPSPSIEVKEAEPEEAPAGSWRQRRKQRGYQILDTGSSLQDWLDRLDPTAPLAVDTETTSLKRDENDLVGVCLAGSGPDGEDLPPAYVPVRWRDAAAEGQNEPDTLFPVKPVNCRLDEVKRVLGPVLAAETSLKVGQNLKFDQWVLIRSGLPLGGPCFDTMLASYVLDPGRRSHGLDDLVLEYLEHRMMPFGELFESGDRHKDILAADPDRLALYAAEDAHYTLQLYRQLEPRLREEGMDGLFQDLEMPVSEVLLRMERNGILIDRKFLTGLRDRFEAELATMEKKIHELAGEPFNIQSPKQLGVILFEKLGLKPIKKTATGWSTDVSVLTALAEEHDLPAIILEYRQVAKLLNTYVETLPQLANKQTGLIHTSYNQAVAATGRLSSSDPNLQNIPIRTELGRLIRQAFVPRSAENVFLSADYSQVELRLLAHLAEDPGLMKAFNEGADVHRRTAALIGGVDEEEVTPQMRYRAKAINFGVIYGMGARALARQIDVSVKEASTFIATYFETYPGVRSFIDSTVELARQQGWVETLLGRRRLLPDINSTNNRIRSFQERVAVNTPIQGTAADLIKLAMIRIQQQLDAAGSPALLLLQVHDELVLEVPEGKLDETREIVSAGMESALELKVPLVVDVHSGRNWAEAHG
jgi:DNA polymerase-1